MNRAISSTTFPSRSWLLAGASTLFLVAAAASGCASTSAATASATKAPPERILVKRVDVDAPIDVVWDTWTTASGLQTFFAPDARIDPCAAGAFAAYHDTASPAPRVDGQIESLVPHARIDLVLQVHGPEAGAAPTTLMVRLDRLSADRTRVTMLHRGWQHGPAWDDAFASYDRAWSEVLARMATRFTEGPVDWSAPSPPRTAVAR